MISPLVFSMLGAGGPAKLMQSLRELSDIHKLRRRRLFYENQQTCFLNDRRQNSWTQKTKNKKRSAGTNISQVRKKGIILVNEHGKVFFTHHAYNSHRKMVQNLQIEGD